MRSFHELSRREEGLTKSVRDIFGEDSVGLFGIGIPLGKAPSGSRMRNARKARRARDAASEDKDGSSSEDDMMGKVEDIIIEAQVPNTQTRPSSKIYLTTWDGYFDIDCSWVRESGMSKTTKDWWTLERDFRYPGYLPVDFPVYDTKTNSLGWSYNAALSFSPTTGSVAYGWCSDVDREIHVTHSNRGLQYHTVS